MFLQTSEFLMVKLNYLQSSTAENKNQEQLHKRRNNSENQIDVFRFKLSFYRDLVEWIMVATVYTSIGSRDE